MKLGDLFNRVWYCTGLQDGIRPLCTPGDPHAEGVVCGWRYQASFIPEDFEAIQHLKLMTPQAISEFETKLAQLGAQLGEVIDRANGVDGEVREFDVDGTIEKILEDGR